MDREIFTVHIQIDLLRSRGESGRILFQNIAVAFIHLEALRETAEIHVLVKTIFSPAEARILCLWNSSQKS
jgi:hypothetical protein